MRPFVLHAHFYQPERLNPWTSQLEPEPSAVPDRDWNERIHRECYGPNGAARVFDGLRRVERIVNNYERLSFNFGPTLLTWLQQAHPRTYARVLDGHWRSVVRTGHGNALAQAYNHMILPLASARDKATQISWGLADFANRFNRSAEGMWLPEAAVDRATIDALIDAGVRFTVLAPHQAARVRPEGGAWRDVHGDMDTGRAYRHRHSDGSGRSLAVLFYDGALAQALAFDPATADAAVLLERMEEAARSHDGLVHAALDGETFGHHHPFGELGLAYALFEAAEQRGLTPTSYAAWLAEHPPVDEVEVVGGEGTSWSCVHGVGRWYRDCGCATDALPGWNQAWRTPLRQALDLVRDAAAEAFTTRGGDLLKDPWAARDDYVRVRLGEWTAAEFVERHAAHQLSDAEQVDLWTLLEAQRFAMMMYTSCGWFFADISGIETVYVLRFAARVLDLLAQVGVTGPGEQVLEVLAEARSNKPGVGTGADVWREHVSSAVMTAPRIGAHLALLTLVRDLPERVEVANAVAQLRDVRVQHRGRLGLATAHVLVTSTTTGRRTDLAVAALHLGGLDFHGVVAPYPGERAFAAAVGRLWEAFPTAPVAQLIRAISEELEGSEFSLDEALPEGRQDIVTAVFGDLTERFQEQYARLYHDHRRILEMLTAAGYELPRDLRAAAELTLAAQLEGKLASVPHEHDLQAFEAVRETLALARSQGYRLDLGAVEEALTAAVTAAAQAAAASLRVADVQAVERCLQLCGELGVDIDLSSAQEYAYEVAAKARVGRLGPDEIATVRRLGRCLGLSPLAWGGSD